MITGLVARLSATLLVGGRPWALTDEEVDQLVETDRVPGPVVLGVCDGLTTARR